MRSKTSLNNSYWIFDKFCQNWGSSSHPKKVFSSFLKDVLHLNWLLDREVVIFKSDKMCELLTFNQSDALIFSSFQGLTHFVFIFKNRHVVLMPQVSILCLFNGCYEKDWQKVLFEIMATLEGDWVFLFCFLNIIIGMHFLIIRSN